jgi:hypothetical protein
VVLGRFLKRHGFGRLLSLESDPEYFDQTRLELELHDLLDVVDLRLAPIVPHRIGETEVLWYETRGLDPGLSIDVLIVDGPPGDLAPLARYPALPLLSPYLRSGAAVLLDDCHREAEQEIVRRWQAEGLASGVRRYDTEAGATIAEFAGQGRPSSSSGPDLGAAKSVTART